MYDTGFMIQFLDDIVLFLPFQRTESSVHVILLMLEWHKHLEFPDLQSSFEDRDISYTSPINVLY